MTKEKKNSISEFFRKEYNNLKNYVNRQINKYDYMDSEDIIQDVMYNIFNRADFTIPLDKLAGYIYKSLKNRIIDLFRKKKVRQLSLDKTIKNDTDCSLYDLLYDEKIDIYDEIIKKEIFAVINSLDENSKTILIATEFEGRKMKDLSQELDVPIGTLLSRKSRAIDKIKDKLRDYYF
ncbi:MAG: sigma-70 family RNA polymerase sigma factor [Spirochaetes bacterium]|nr:sigma-70 family RNA polymerase sigma factor [Spirochaetota bacterium]